mgnify:CR=1 FL=1
MLNLYTLSNIVQNYINPHIFMFFVFFVHIYGSNLWIQPLPLACAAAAATWQMRPRIESVLSMLATQLLCSCGPPSYVETGNLYKRRSLWNE